MLKAPVRYASAIARSRSTRVLAVHSVIIPAETNYLLNPRHRAFAEISVGEPQELITDLRLTRNRQR